MFVVVEKILSGDEEVPSTWRAEGTTGYDFLNKVNELFVDAERGAEFDALYREFTGDKKAFSEGLYECKKQVMEESFAGDIDNLTRLFLRTLQNRPYGKNLSFEGVWSALVELFAFFPVYRTYISQRPNHESQAFCTALALAKQKNGELGREFSAFEQLLGECPSATDAAFAIMRLQQFSGVVMAKGVEDTALYRFSRLLSLCEVGGDPAEFGQPISTFHSFNVARQSHWPLTLNATSTHDAKRGEDARARLNVLSEIPAEFKEHLWKWTALNEHWKRCVDGKPAPDRGEEYYLYQTLIGAYPFSQTDTAKFAVRLKTHFVKALREAKVHSNWHHPNQQYEEAATEFAADLLDPQKASGFLEDFLPFQEKIAQFGVYNSLAQTLLKTASPGIPDFYQGAELWDLNLVDPDNRRPVDFKKRQELLAKIA
jgi:(1->4)-alpha-D-glucan 1-alpha-D-glucosylmutase